MYEKYFGFSTKPFSLLPDPSFLFMTKSHTMALTMLEYSLTNESAGICVISGEIGSGKTTLIRQLLNEVSDHFNIGLLTNTQCKSSDLLQWISMAFGLDYKNMQSVELYDNFINFTINQYARGKRSVLIIDEAQNLSDKTLEELRMLSNINADKDQVLQLILVGQPELRKIFRLEHLEQLNQRVTITCHLSELNRHESCLYVKHRLKAAGGDPMLFSESACKAVWYHSLGIPRLINTICDTALVYAYAEHRNKIDIRLVNDVVRDRKIYGFYTKDNSSANNVTRIGDKINRVFNT